MAPSKPVTQPLSTSTTATSTSATSTISMTATTATSRHARRARARAWALSAAILASLASPAALAKGGNAQAVTPGTGATATTAESAIVRDARTRTRCAAPSAGQCLSATFADTACGRKQLRATTSTCASLCPTPVLAQCHDEDYLASICGQLEARKNAFAAPLACVDGNAATSCPPGASVCGELLRAENEALQNAGQSIVPPGAVEATIVLPQSVDVGDTVTDQVSLDENGYADPASTITVPVVDADFDDWENAGTGRHYWALMNRESAAFRQSPAGGLLGARDLFALRRAQYAQNGNRVADCREYVYEKYFDISVYEDSLRTAGSSARTAWEAAYGPAGADASIGTRGVLAEAQGNDLVLRQRDGTALPQAITFSGQVRPKNEFFETPVVVGDERLEAFATHDQNGGFAVDLVLVGDIFGVPRPVRLEGVVLLDDDLSARFEDVPTIVEGWTYHRDRGEQFGPEFDDQMAALDRIREDYPILLMRRFELVDRIEAIIRNTQDFDVVAINDVPFDPAIFESVVQNSTVGIVEQRREGRALLDVDADAASSFDADVVFGTGFLGGGAGALPQFGAPVFGGGTLMAMSGQAPSPGLNFAGSLVGVSSLVGSPLAGVARPLSQQETVLSQIGKLVQQMADVDAEIEATLIEARRLGCLESEFTTCDWSPLRFVQRTNDQFVAERERDLRKCLVVTNDDFSGRDIDVDVPRRFKVILPIDNNDNNDDDTIVDDAVCDDPRYDANPRRLERYFRCFAAWKRGMLEALEESLRGAEGFIDPETGQIEPNESDADAEEQGDDLFGLSYAYNVDWRLQDLPQEGAANEDDSEKWCALRPSLAAGFRVDGTFLGADFELVDAAVDAGVQPGDENVAFVEIAGVEFIRVEAKDDSFDIRKFNVLFQETRVASFTLFQFSYTMTIGPVWVNVGGGVAGNFGVAIIGGAGTLPNRPGDCGAGQLGLEGRFEPFFGFNGFLSAGLDYYIIAVGVKITLTIIRVSFPYNVRLTFEGKPSDADPSGVDVRMVLANNLDLAITALSGKIEVYIQVCFIICEDWSATLFRWDGLRFSETIFHSELQLPLGTLIQFQDDAEAGFGVALP